MTARFTPASWSVLLIWSSGERAERRVGVEADEDQVGDGANTAASRGPAADLLELHVAADDGRLAAEFERRAGGEARGAGDELLRGRRRLRSALPARAPARRPVAAPKPHWLSSVCVAHARIVRITIN